MLHSYPYVLNSNRLCFLPFSMPFGCLVKCNSSQIMALNAYNNIQMIIKEIILKFIIIMLKKIDIFIYNLAVDTIINSLLINKNNL